MAEKLSEEGYLTLDEHGKFDTRELEDKFAEQLRGVNQYSTQVDPELLDYSQDMDLLQRYAEGRTTKGKLSLDWIEAKYGVIVIFTNAFLKALMVLHSAVEKTPM